MIAGPQGTQGDLVALYRACRGLPPANTATAPDTAAPVKGLPEAPTVQETTAVPPAVTHT